MIEASAIIVSVIPPLLLVSSGLVAERSISSHLGKTTLVQKLLLWIALGYILFVLPYIIVGITTDALQIYVLLHALLTAVGLLIRRSAVLDVMRTLLSTAKASLSGLDLVRGWALLSFVFFAAKVVFMCMLGPIVSGDALYLWLSMGKVFFNLNRIPLYDPYHFWDYNAEPGSSILYSWGFFFAGSSEIEVFRGIPIAFFLALPLTAFQFTKDWSGSGRAAYIALALVCYIPIMDYVVYAYSFYVDALAAFMALFSIMTSRSAIEQTSPSWAIIAGLSWAVTMISRYAFGILAGAAILLQLLALLGISKRAKLSTLVLTASLVTGMILLGNETWSFLSNPLSLLSFVPLTLLFLWFRFGDGLTPSPRLKQNILVLLSFVVGAVTSLLWGIRSLYNGAALFGIDLIRLQPIPNEVQRISDLLNEIFPVATTAERFTVISPIGFLFHILMNGYFAPVAVVLVAICVRKRIASGAGWVCILWYIGYLSLMGYFPSGRHLLVCAVSLCPLLAIGILSLSESLSTRNFQLSPAALMILFCLLSIPQMMTSALAVGALGIQGLPVLAQIVVPYTTDFGLDTTPGIVLQLAAVGMIVCFTVFFFSYVLGRRTLGRKLRGVRRTPILVLALSSLLIMPMMVHAAYVTQGDMLSYDELGSWNGKDYLLAALLHNLVSPDDIILTYGDVVLSYSGFRVLDLYRTGAYAFPSLVNATNPVEIQDQLWSFGVRFIVLPTEDSYLYSSYAKYVNVIPFPEIVVGVHGDWLANAEYKWRVYAMEVSPGR